MIRRPTGSTRSDKLFHHTALFESPVMADKGWRRSGFARRAQMGAFVGLVLSVLAIVVGVVLLVRSAFGNDDVSGARGVALDVTAPIAAAIGAPFRWAAGDGRGACRERVGS